MADVHTPAQRSFNMSRIRDRNTSPEMRVRSLLHSLGYRFRLHVRSLPGSPDIVLPKHRTVIFVHGCFWHMHACRFGKVTPKTNAEFWRKKRTGNVERDKKQRRILRKDWSVLTLWECQTRDVRQLALRLTRFLRPQM